MSLCKFILFESFDFIAHVLIVSISRILLSHKDHQQRPADCIYAMRGNHRDRTESDKILLAVPPTTGALHPSLSTSYSTVVPLLARQFCRLQDLGAGHTTAGPVPPTISQLPTATPLVPDAWERALRAHPNQ